MKLLCPNQVLASVRDIDLDALWQKGIRGLLLDLDNTLVRWDSHELTEEFRVWVKSAQALGYKLCLVSNGVPRRVRGFAKHMEIPAIVKAFKPRRRPFAKGMQEINLNSSQVAMVGDQLFTDVLGANRLGIYTILINPLSDQELRGTRFMRKIEGHVLRRLVKKGWIPNDALLCRNGRF